MCLSPPTPHPPINVHILFFFFHAALCVCVGVFVYGAHLVSSAHEHTRTPIHMYTPYYFAGVGAFCALRTHTGRPRKCDTTLRPCTDLNMHTEGRSIKSSFFFIGTACMTNEKITHPHTHTCEAANSVWLADTPGGCRTTTRCWPCHAVLPTTLFSDEEKKGGKSGGRIKCCNEQEEPQLCCNG